MSVSLKCFEIGVGGLEEGGGEVFQLFFLSCSQLLTLHKFTTGDETSGFLS